MKAVVKNHTLCAFIVGCAFTGVSQEVSQIEIQISEDMEVWDSLPANTLQVTPDGWLIHAVPADKLFYRLSLRRENQIDSGTAMPASEVPRETLAIAQEFLDQFSNEEAGEVEEGDSEDQDYDGWVNPVLGDVVYPIFNPSINEGKTPAFYEFPVFEVNPLADYKPGPFAPNFPLDPSRDCAEQGSLIVSATRETEPVPSFSTAGLPQVEKLWRHAGTSNVRPILYDAGFMVGEDSAGNPIASLGNQPFAIDSTPIVEMLEKNIESYAFEDDPAGPSGDEVQGENPRLFESYDDFLEYYVEDPLMIELRYRRREAAAWEWDVQTGVLPNEEIMFVGEQRTLELGSIVTGFIVGETGEALDTKAITVRLNSAGGVTVIANAEGGAPLKLFTSDGKQINYVVSVVGTAGGTGGACGWRSWKYWYAGSWGDQKRYSQFWNDSQMCPNGPSGCGPTAWAMSYGWWDRKGARRVMGNTSSADSPSSNNNDVRAVCRDVFDEANTWCVDFLSASATNPWDMRNGIRWAIKRGAGYSVSSRWGAPYVSWSPRNKARDGIKANRPAIIGIGFYWHYVLAYGYKEREWRCAGVTWDRQYYFKCNMGWGGSEPQWRNANSVWFGHNARFW